MSQTDDIKRLIIKHRRRLQELKEQKALYGISVDPRIPVEIDDIESEIAHLELELETASDVNDELPAKSSLVSSSSGQSSSNNFFGGVQIGHIDGSISNSNIAGGDINITNTSGQPSTDNEKPMVEDLQILLAEIHTALTELSAQKEVLQSVSTMAPFTAMGAEQGVKDAMNNLKEDVKPEEAKSILRTLNEVVSLLENILDKATSVVQKTDAAGNAVKPLAEKLAPLIENLGLAIGWIAKIWMLGLEL